MKNSLKAVTIGDIDGIGIQILIKLWKNKRLNNFILVTNLNLFNKFLNKEKIKLPLKKINDQTNNLKIYKKYFLVFDIIAKNFNENAYNSLIESYNLVKKLKCSAIITLPINKEKINKNIDKNFIGQTEFFQKLDSQKISNMFFYSKKIIITSLTTHIPLTKVGLFFKKNQKNLYNKIESINDTLIKDFNIKKPKLIISGINPHAGENGVIGQEEGKYLIPLIKKIKKEKINIQGPVSADTLFTKENLKKYDCFICTYHDQALIPFKLINEFNGINYTGSLSIIRLSPAHGTAYKLKVNEANLDSIYECFKLSNKIYYNRKINNN